MDNGINQSSSPQLSQPEKSFFTKSGNLMSGIKALILETIIIIVGLVVVLSFLAVFGIIDLNTFVDNRVSEQVPIQQVQIPPTLTPPSANMFAATTQDVLVSSTLESNFEGEIVEIDIAGETEKFQGDYKYQIKIVIKNSTPTAAHATFLFDKQMVNKINVFQVEGDEEKDISINQLAVGDKISLTTVFKYDKQNGEISKQFVNGIISKL